MARKENGEYLLLSKFDEEVVFEYHITIRDEDFNLLFNRKTPETLRFRGILRLDTTLSCDNKSIFRLYYSMIVATRPDPTVRPPSRYQTGVLRYTNSDFLCDLCGKIRIFRCVRVVFRNFCYHGVITVFLVFLAYFFLHS